MVTAKQWSNPDTYRKQIHGELRVNNLNLYNQDIRLVLGVELLHVSVPLYLRLIPIDTTFHLTSERQEMLVNELGSQAVASVLLGSLDVLVDQVLRLEPLIAALIRAGEGAQASMIHLVQLEACFCGISR